MEKGGLRRLGRLFHKSESEDSEPDTSRETPLPSPCPSPSLQGKRQQRLSSPPVGGGGERKKRSAFGNWRLKKKQQQHKERPAAGAEASGDSSQLSAPASPSLSLASSFTFAATTSEPTTPTDSTRKMCFVAEKCLCNNCASRSKTRYSNPRINRDTNRSINNRRSS